MNHWIYDGLCGFSKLLPRVAYPVLCGPLRGTKFVFGALAGECGGASVYLNKVEPEQTAAFAETLKKGQIVFDVGANVGYYTMLAARLVGPHGKVFAFEPVARNIAYLYRHVLLNKMNNVIIVPGACSDTLSLQSFVLGQNFAVGHLSEDNETCNTSPVLAVSVDDVVRKLGVCPSVIKIDVEGAEMAVLRGAANVLRTMKPKIFLSTHSDILKTTCLQYLKECGYVCEALDQNKTNASEFLAKHVRSNGF